MKILMVAPTPFFADRGCHVRILGEVESLQAMGHEVRVCTYHNGRDVEGVRTERIVPIPWYRRLEAGPSNHKYYLDVLLFLKALRVGLGWKPDVVHAHLHEGAAIAVGLKPFLRRPVVFDYQGSLTDELRAHGYVSDGLPLRFFGRVERWVEKRSDHVITSTDGAAQRLRDSADIEATTVRDGVDSGRFVPLTGDERKEVRAELGLPGDAVVALFIGVLTSYQGVDLLLEQASAALEGAPDLHLLVVGYPHEAYEEKARDLELGDRIRFTGRVPFERTPALTGAADFALAPKMSRSEGNLKLYNYLSCGLPVVVFDTPANREVMDETGLYVPYGDGPAFAEAMVRLAVDVELRSRLSDAARTRAVEDLSWRSSAEKIDGVYADVIGGRRPLRRATVAGPV